MAADAKVLQMVFLHQHRLRCRRHNRFHHLHGPEGGGFQLAHHRDLASGVTSALEGSVPQGLLPLPLHRAGTLQRHFHHRSVSGRQPAVISSLTIATHLL